MIWTDADDDRLMQLRGQGCDWRAIACAMAVSCNAAMERGRFLHAKLPARVKVVADALEDPDRCAMKPGHPVSWAVLTAGTLLEGDAYPPPKPIGHRWPDHFNC